MRARVAASIVLAAGLALGASGCSFFAPQGTLANYDASDGVSATVGNLQVRNAFGITNDGKSVNLVMVLVNTGDTEISATLQYGFGAGKPGTGSSASIPVPAHGVISFGNGTTPQLVLPNTSSKPGTLLPLFVQYGQESGKELQVPVLDSSLTAYSTLVPTPIPTPTSTGTPIPTGTPTPAP